MASASVERALGWSPVTAGKRADVLRARRRRADAAVSIDRGEREGGPPRRCWSYCPPADTVSIQTRRPPPAAATVAKTDDNESDGRRARAKMTA